MLKNASRKPALPSDSNAGGTSGHALSTRYASISSLRLSGVRSSFSISAANDKLSSVACQKSAYCPDKARSHWYSNCLVRQALLSSAPFQGKSCSASAKTGRGSKIGKASKAIALIFDPVPDRAERVDAKTPTALPAAAKLRNSRRVNDMISSFISFKRNVLSR